MTVNGRPPSAVGRGSISIITILLALPKLLLLPSLAGAFFAPIGVFSSAARSPASTLSGGQGGSKTLGRHAGAPPSGIFAGDKSGDTSAGANANSMSPPDAGAAGGAAAAAAAAASGGDDLTDQRLAPAAAAVSAAGDKVGVTGPVGPAPVAGVGGGVVAADQTLANVANGKRGSAAAVSTLWNVPNILTMARVVAIPVFATIFYADLPRRNIWCSFIFAGAAFTDWLDGYIARRQGIVTPFGSFLDPVADKLLVSTALILLSERLGPWMTICSAIILCRELGISALREWMAQLGLRETVKVGNAGKWKTATQMIALSLLLLLEPGAAFTLINPVTFMPLAKGLLYVSTILTVTSGTGYLQAAWPALMGHDAKKQED